MVLFVVKTAVSIPNKLFASADKLARRLGISRSELYATALARLLARQEEQAITEQLNRLYARQSSALDPALRAARRKALPRDDW